MPLDLALVRSVRKDCKEVNIKSAHCLGEMESGNPCVGCL